MNVPGRSQSNRTREVSCSHQKEFQSFSYKEYKAGGGGRLNILCVSFILASLTLKTPYDSSLTAPQRISPCVHFSSSRFIFWLKASFGPVCDQAAISQPSFTCSLRDRVPIMTETGQRDGPWCSGSRTPAVSLRWPRALDLPVPVRLSSNSQRSPASACSAVLGLPAWFTTNSSFPYFEGHRIWPRSLLQPEP